MLSRKSKYGLKALLVLAREAGHGPVLISELAAREAIPKKFLEAILLELDGLTGNYHLVVDREAARLDTLEIRIEAAPGADHGALSQLAERRVRDSIGLTVKVTVLPAGALPRSEGKAKRVVDLRDL